MHALIHSPPLEVARILLSASTPAVSAAVSEGLRITETDSTPPMVTDRCDFTTGVAFSFSLCMPPSGSAFSSAFTPPAVTVAFLAASSLVDAVDVVVLPAVAAVDDGDVPEAAAVRADAELVVEEEEEKEEDAKPPPAAPVMTGEASPAARCKIDGFLSLGGWGCRGREARCVGVARGPCAEPPVADTDTDTEE